MIFTVEIFVSERYIIDPKAFLEKYMDGLSKGKDIIFTPSNVWERISGIG